MVELWKLPAMLVLFFLLWAVISFVPWFAGPRGGYGIHSDGEDWGDFAAPFLAFVSMAGIVHGLLGWDL